MRKKIPSPSLLVILLLLILHSCNEIPASDKNVSQSEALANKSTESNFPAYDESKGVTVISPEIYKQLTDTLGIRMITGIYKPGDSSIMHAHPDFALYVVEPGLVELTGEDGSKQSIEFKKDMPVIMPASIHSAKNIGNTTLKLIVVEVNRPRG